jgi:sarcosine oxidase subunit alpha
MKRIENVQRGASLKIFVDGKAVEAFVGETVAAALFAAGVSFFRLSHKHKQPRSLYCGMGVCYECLVTVNGVHAQRACVTLVEDGMKVETCKEVEV